MTVVMSIFFTVLGAGLLIQCLLALLGVARFDIYCRRMSRTRSSRYQPKSVVIVPCKGLEPELEENIRAYLTQDYRDYEMIFVTESAADPAYGLLSRVVKQSRRPCWLVVAGEAQNQGQKVHNLIAGVDMLDSIDRRRIEVLVFADSDARPSNEWLSELVAPLEPKDKEKEKSKDKDLGADHSIGATTGFRWYAPVNGRLGSLLLSAWNSSAIGLLGARSKFAWGGSMAIRRENFNKLEIRKHWEGAISDDYVLTSAVLKAGLNIKFVPRCLVPSPADAGIKELLEFTTRQLRITRVYSPQVWKLSFWTNLLYNFTVWAGLLWTLSLWAAGVPGGPFLYLLIPVFLIGAATGMYRAWIANRLLSRPPEQAQPLQRWWVYGALGPLVSLVYLYNLIASIWNNRIVWREIAYELISPNETVILHRPTQTSARQTTLSTKAKPGSVRSSSQKR
jgi:ceramide glucosyltransferase